MKTKVKLLLLFTTVTLVSLTSCDKVKTSKFDGTYDCTTVSDSSDPDLALVTTSFKSIINIQSMEIDISGKATDGIDVANDGTFHALIKYDLLITTMDVVIDGTVSTDGTMSGTITESQDVLGAISVTRTGTFSGSAE